MSALDSVRRLLDTSLPLEGLRWCLVNEKKNPFKTDGARASTNEYSDFCTFEELASCDSLDEWAGVGISVQASGVIAIDLDHCAAEKNREDSLNEQARDIVKMFSPFAYIEFSFSGTGIRILFRDEDVNPYKSRYYIKNSEKKIEYYQPEFDGTPSNRFVTVTGNTIVSNSIEGHFQSHRETLNTFLESYMKRKETVSSESEKLLESHDARSLGELEKILKMWLLRDQSFQDDWFKEGVHPTVADHDESERDFRIISFITSHITTDREKTRLLFEESPFFKSKDKSHVRKWEYNSYRYFNWQFEHSLR